MSMHVCLWAIYWLTSPEQVQLSKSPVGDYFCSWSNCFTLPYCLTFIWLVTFSHEKQVEETSRHTPKAKILKNLFALWNTTKQNENSAVDGRMSAKSRFCQRTCIKNIQKLSKLEKQTVWFKNRGKVGTDPSPKKTCVWQISTWKDVCFWCVSKSFFLTQGESDFLAFF